MSIYQPPEKQTTRGESRRQAMLEAAWEALIEKGLSVVTLTDILDRSGGSKATLYATFGDKEGLLIQAVQQRIERFIEQLNVSLKADQPPAIALREYALTYAGRIVEPDAIRFYHLMMSGSQHMAPVILQFLKDGPTQTQRHLANYLRNTSQAGELEIKNPDCAADLLLTMLQGQGIFNVFAHTLTGDLLEAHKQKAKDRAIAAVDLFLKASQTSKN